jgi:Domain of unknown function (DUF6815)
VKIGLLWRAEWDPPGSEPIKLHGVFDAFAALGVPAAPVVWSDDRAGPVREQLLGLDGVLVWVNPVEQGLDRSRLDAVLREVAAAGVWVSAHPDVIQKIATKQVLVDTRHMSWGTDTRLHRTSGELLERLRGLDAAIVLKQRRGMGGNGVWKAEPEGELLRVQHAVRDSEPERLPADAFVARCASYFADGGFMVEQPFQPRLREGMVRAYMTHDRVVGFAHQYPRGLLTASEARDLPTAKVFELPTVHAYATLRERIESEWIAQLQEAVGVETASLPVIWDADFLHGDNGYVLCEINASSTFAFPEHAMPGVAQAAIERIVARA